MGKHYQVFISSTFQDLQEERWEAVKALLMADCIPAGMESFPAVDEEQFKYIKNLIDECDYYVLILGGRYGSLAPDGVGFTEKEFDYAVSKGIKVIALVYKDPNSLPPEKRETVGDSLTKFTAFRDKVCTGRLVAFWETKEDLPSKIAFSIMKAVKDFPAVGWVRANTVATENILSEINTLRKEKERLEKELTALKEEMELKEGTDPKLDDISDIHTYIKIRYSYKQILDMGCNERFINIEIGKLFSLIAPVMRTLQSLITIYKSFLSFVLIEDRINIYPGLNKYEIFREDFDTFMIQIEALGLITYQHIDLTDINSGKGVKLTAKGYKLMLELRILKNTDPLSGSAAS